MEASFLFCDLLEELQDVCAQLMDLPTRTLYSLTSRSRYELYYTNNRCPNATLLKVSAENGWYSLFQDVRTWFYFGALPVDIQQHRSLAVSRGHVEFFIDVSTQSKEIVSPNEMNLLLSKATLPQLARAFKILSMNRIETMKSALSMGRLDVAQEMITTVDAFNHVNEFGKRWPYRRQVIIHFLPAAIAFGQLALVRWVEQMWSLRLTSLNPDDIKLMALYLAERHSDPTELFNVLRSECIGLNLSSILTHKPNPPFTFSTPSPYPAISKLDDPQKYVDSLGFRDYYSGMHLEMYRIDPLIIRWLLLRGIISHGRPEDFLKKTPRNKWHEIFENWCRALKLRTHLHEEEDVF